MSKPIKSTLELAMEKAAKLPKLTKREIRERQEREYGPLGQAVARRLLTGDLVETGLEVELFKHEGDRGEIIRKAFLVFMCQSIDLEGAETNTKAFESVKTLTQDDHLEEMASRVNAICRDYERQKRRRWAATEQAESACLRDAGVSGSAIRLNLQEHEGWRRELSELQQAFRPKLDEVKQELTDRAVRSCSKRQAAETRGS